MPVALPYNAAVGLQWVFLTMLQVGMQCVIVSLALHNDDTSLSAVCAMIGLQCVIVSVAIPNGATGWSAVCAYGLPAECDCVCGSS